MTPFNSAGGYMTFFVSFIDMKREASSKFKVFCSTVEHNILIFSIFINQYHEVNFIFIGMEIAYLLMGSYITGTWKQKNLIYRNRLIEKDTRPFGHSYYLVFRFFHTVIIVMR